MGYGNDDKVDDGNDDDDNDDDNEDDDNECDDKNYYLHYHCYCHHYHHLHHHHYHYPYYHYHYHNQTRRAAYKQINNQIKMKSQPYPPILPHSRKMQHNQEREHQTAPPILITNFMDA